MKRKAFTLIELVITIGIVALLSTLLTPKAKTTIDNSKQVGVDKNKNLFSSIVTLKKEQIGMLTTIEDMKDFYTTKIENNSDLKETRNPFNKKQKGVGFIIGDTYDNTDKALYIFTRQPQEDTLPKGTVYTVLTNDEVISVTETRPQKTDIIVTNAYTIFQKGDKLLGSGNGGSNKLMPNSSKVPIELTIDASNVKQVAAGYNDIIVLYKDGTAKYWGTDYYGESGTEKGGLETIATTLINEPLLLDNIYSVATRGDYTIVLKQDGTLWGVGDNLYGQLGLSNNVHQKSFTKLPLDNVKEISAGSDHTLALTYSGEVYITGTSWNGQLGLGSKTSTTKFLKLSIPKVKQIVACENSSALLTTTNEVYVSGTFEKEYLSFTKLPLTNIQKIALGSGFVLALDDAGEVHFMGNNSIGQAALPIGPYAVPQKLPIQNIKDIFANTSQIYLEDTENNLYGLGSNNYGLLGYGDTINKTTIIKNPNIDFK